MPPDIHHQELAAKIAENEKLHMKVSCLCVHVCKLRGSVHMYMHVYVCEVVELEYLTGGGACNMHVHVYVILARYYPVASSLKRGKLFALVLYLNPSPTTWLFA